MDIAVHGGTRNGLDSGYFNFAPLIPIAGGIILSKKAREKRAKKYSSAELQQLQNDFPFADTSDGQLVVIQNIKARRSFWESELSKSKAKKTKDRVKAYIKSVDEYLKDANDYLDEVLKSEKEAADLAAQAQPAPMQGGLPSEQPSPVQTIPMTQVPLGQPLGEVISEEVTIKNGQPVKTITTTTGTTTLVGAAATDKKLAEQITGVAQPASKKTNWLLIGGVLVGALVLIKLMKK